MEDGFRLPPPRNCPSPLHRLMLDCWQKDPGERPRFSQIHGLLSKMLQDPEPPRCADTTGARYGVPSPVPGAFPTVPGPLGSLLSAHALPPQVQPPSCPPPPVQIRQLAQLPQADLILPPASGTYSFSSQSFLLALGFAPRIPGTVTT